MSDSAAEGMIRQLLAAGQRAIRLHLEGDTDEEHAALEFMDALWDQMTPAARTQALARLRASGLEEFANRIDAGRADL